MMQLNKPKHKLADSIKECLDGIVRLVDLKTKLNDAASDLSTACTDYTVKAELGELFRITPIASLDQDPKVIRELKKSELIKIYDQYFVPDGKPARVIYNVILNSSKDECPFCGGIGVPKNLDHFLPKSLFPQFSIFPNNLIPSCLDCNLSEKKENFSSTPEHQIIHPYLDKGIFFTTQWIFADYDEVSKVFTFSVNLPQTWNAHDKQKANSHFKKFNIAKRYARKASQEVSVPLHQIRSMRSSGLSNDMIIQCLIKPGMEPSKFPNHWRSIMFQALEKKINAL